MASVGFSTIYSTRLYSPGWYVLPQYCGKQLDHLEYIADCIERSSVSYPQGHCYDSWCGSMTGGWYGGQALVVWPVVLYILMMGRIRIIDGVVCVLIDMPTWWYGIRWYGIVVVIWLISMTSDWMTYVDSYIVNLCTIFVVNSPGRFVPLWHDKSSGIYFVKSDIHHNSWKCTVVYCGITFQCMMVEAHQRNSIFDIWPASLRMSWPS